MGNSVSSSTAMAVAPAWTRFLRMLSRTMSAIAARLTTRSTMLKRLLPIGRVKISASMQMLLTIRNMRSRRPIL